MDAHIANELMLQCEKFTFALQHKLIGDMIW